MMDPDDLNAFNQAAAEELPSLECTFSQGEKRRFIQTSSINDPKLQELITFLIDWINATLKHEHIVVRSLEEDLYDGLVLHHLLEKYTSAKLEVDEIALSSISQKHKLGVVLEAVSKNLQPKESPLKWSVEQLYNKDLLATLHLLVAIGQHFQPDLEIPLNISVEVVTVEPTKHGIKTEKTVEYVTEGRKEFQQSSPIKTDAFDELFKLAPDKVNAVKQAIVLFVNKHLGNLGIGVTDIDSQFSDGVILLLLIGQLEGYFLNLCDFFLTPCTQDERLHNARLAVDLLMDGGLLDRPVNPEDIVNREVKTLLRVLYSLFSKYK